ncbi:MAG: 23S rRNA (adenine(2503)-C(2))-methyltransferase RlmN [Geobacteraceae bacterium]|nr:23S rRNA (adenine(2503)-C(2))-methyltransferase RlmN [Geobacteraceae bacterium]
MGDTKVDLRGLTSTDLIAFLAGLGKERFRSKQLMSWMYKKNVSDFSQMTDLSKDLRAELEQRAYISEWTPETEEVSADGTRKYLFRLTDDESIETVLIPMESGRSTLCISSQAGCAMQCDFCLTGSFGLKRNLTTAEIVNQVCAIRREHHIHNIVVMGMGEPLQNLDNMVSALEIFYDPAGMDYSSRKITLSTCGLVPQMHELARRINVNLAVSLNASNDEVRSRLMPVNKRYPLRDLIQACRDFPLHGKRRITFEYILIRDLNDSIADARRLVKLLHEVKAKVNLIPFNEHEGSIYKCPSEENINAFQSFLLQRNIVAIRRASKGQDISAACGQLKGKLKSESHNTKGVERTE